MWRYVAYGLELRSPLPLPGMQPVAETQLPALTLSNSTPAVLASEWSGPRDLPRWSGRLGDGCELIIERGRSGDVLFTYGDRARFRLDPSWQLLDCAPEREGLDWQRALLCKIVCHVSIMRGYEGLHASVVDSPEGVLAFAGPSGAGKSTLAIELVQRGWRLFADDVLILGSDASGVWAHPATPHMTLAEEVLAQIGLDKPDDTLASACGERWLTVDSLRDWPRPVRMLCVVERRAGLTLETEYLSASPLPLAPYMLGFRGDEDRQRRRFEVYADLVNSAMVVRLSAGLEHRPSELADVVEQTLRQPLALAGSAR